MAANVLTNTKQDLIAAEVLRELKENASLLGLVKDYSHLAIKGAKSISIPKLSSFTVGDRAFGAAGSETSALTDGVDTIDLDHNKYIRFGVDMHDEMQSTIEYKLEATRRAAAAHGRAVNTAIVSVWESTAGLNINAGVPADITSSDILDMREFLMVNEADMAQARLVIAPDQEKAMLKLPEFSRNDYRGDSVLITGQIGQCYGVPVIVHNSVKAQQGFMVIPEGVGFAFQKAPAVAEAPNLSYGTGGVEIAVDQLFGVDGLFIAEGTAAAGKTPFVCKLID